MKRNVPTTLPAQTPSRPRPAKPQAVQASLFASEPAAAPVPTPRKPRAVAAAQHPAVAMAPQAHVKNAKTNPSPKTLMQTPRRNTAGAVKTKIAKTNPDTRPVVLREQPVRVVNDPVFEGGSLWKMSGKNGVAYIKDAALAGELLAIDPKKLAQAAMAVYYDKKGKAFAWQVRFDTDRWDELLRRLA